MRLHSSKLLAFAAFTAAAALSLTANAQSITTQIAFSSPLVQGIAVDPFLNSIYAVVSSGYPDVNDTVAVIDGNTDTVLTNISVPVGAYYPAVNLHSNRVYVASCNTFDSPTKCFVTVIDGRSNTVVATIPIVTVKDGLLNGIAVNSITGLVYVADYTDGNIVVIDTGKNVVKQTISLNGAHPYGVAINPFNNKLYVTIGSSSIDILDTTTNKITQASTGADTVSENVAVDLFTGRVYVVNTQFGPSTVVVLSATGQQIASILSGQYSYGIDVDPLSSKAFVASSTNGNTDVFDLNTNTELISAEGTSPFFVSVNPFSQKVYNSGGGVVTVTTE